VAILLGGVQTALLATLHNRFNFPLHPCRLRCFGKLEHELVLGVVVCGVAIESVTHPLGRVGNASASNAFLHGLSRRRLLDGKFLVSLGLLAKTTCLQFPAVSPL